MPNASTFTVSVVPSKGVMPSPQAAHDGANNLKKKKFFFGKSYVAKIFREIAQKKFNSIITWKNH